MCGIMLKHHGYDVTVLEQARASRRGHDAGIKLGPASEEFLSKHDRVRRDMTITCRPGFMIDVNGHPKAQRGQTMLMTSWGLLTSVLRANFDGLTSAAVPVAPGPQSTDGKAVFRFGACVTSIVDVGDRVEVQLLNVDSGITEKLRAGIVIAADGSHSALRSKLLPDAKRKYAGYMCWRGTVREKDIDDEWNELYSEKATFHLMENTYMLKYSTQRRCPAELTDPVTLFRRIMEISDNVSACTTGFGTRITRLKNQR
jgi:2-polyprenyl-6-methoxyphenol hydroxylase-like FAD-dependent oxidoreductase